MRRLFIRMTLLCGVLDAIYASIWSILAGGNVGRTWRYVASGPLGDQAKEWGATGIFAGLAVHFLLMAVMVGAFLWIVRAPWLKAMNPWLLGTVYGLGLYLVMNGLVVPIRFGAPFNPAGIKDVLLPLFPHIAFIGIPLALAARRIQHS